MDWISWRPRISPACALDDLGEVGGDDGGRVHHRVAQPLGLVALGFRDPEGRQAEGRVAGGLPGDLLAGAAGVDGQVEAHPDDPPPHLDPLDLEAVLGGLQAHVVDDADARDHQAQVQGRLPPDARDPVQELRALVLVHQRDQAVAELQGQGVQGHHRGDLHRARPCRGPPPPGPSPSPPRWPGAGADSTRGPPARRARGSRTYQGKPGQEAHDRQHPAGDQVGRDCRENWLVRSCPKVASETARVTMMPVAVEMRRAGSWVTRPSPMVREM